MSNHDPEPGACLSAPRIWRDCDELEMYITGQWECA